MRRRVAAFTLCALFVVGSFLIATTPANAQSGSCSGPAFWFGRAKWCGYFKNRFYDEGHPVRIGGVPSGVNRVEEFITLVRNDLLFGNDNRRTSAQFIILTMIGRGPGAPQAVNGTQLADWESRVRSYANLSETGATSYGVNGRIDFFVWQHMNCGVKNTYYQEPHVDVAPFTNHAGNSDCEVSSVVDDFIVFRNTAGAEMYRIRRECMNPMGTIRALATNPPPNFNLNPSISPTVNGTPGSVAQVGDTVRFTFTVNNTGTTQATNINCNTYATQYPGYHAGGSPPPGGSPAGPNPGCPRNFPVGSTIVATQDVAIAAENQTICRTLTVNPATFGGSARTTNEVCVIVAAKPYLKVFGGDISAGSGLETAPDTCTNNNNAAVISWNKRAAGGYAGAGAQYATFALSRITDFATAQGNVGGAPVPQGLSFGNTATNVGTGNFGGNFGSVTCIADYYARRPATTSGLPANVTAMTTGAYAGSGNVTMTGGNVNPGEKISVYIDGNLYITSNITYPGSWSHNNIPLFQLIVRGNIYVSGSVTQLDGVYIAQRNGASGGTIYTCASGFTAPVLTNGAFFGGCLNKLTVNGAFIANSVEFLRAGGSLQDSTPGETSGGSTAGEVFNFTPSIWMTQPLDTSGRVDNYDAITSLPPVL